jgi:hypothetical protein
MRDKAKSILERAREQLGGNHPDLPLQSVSGNVIVTDGQPAGVYRVDTKSFEFLSDAEKERLWAKLSWWFLQVEANFSIYRVCRSYPSERYVANTVSMIDERFADRARWERLLDEHEKRIESMRSFTPEVYFVVSLRKSRNLISNLQRGRDFSSLVVDSEQDAFETLIDSLDARRATTLEIQWLIRRAATRGVCEPDVDSYWDPPALTLDGGMWSPGRADIEEFMASITKHSRHIGVEGEDGESLQAMFTMGKLPKKANFPGNAEFLFAPLEKLDFPVDAVQHVRWVSNKTMQTKADDAVKDSSNAIIDALARHLDHKTARRIDEAKFTQDYFANEPFPPGLEVCTSFAVGVPPDDYEKLKERCKRLQRVYPIKLYQNHALQEPLYGDHMLRADGGQVRKHKRLINREVLAAMMPIGSHEAGSKSGFYIAYTIPGIKRPIFYDMLEASATNRAGAIELIGTLGSGKTMALQYLEYLAARRGSLVVDVDPRPDHSLERLPGLEDMVNAINLSNLEAHRGELDPLVVAPEELREELASGYMMEILPNCKAEWQTEIIDAVRTVLRQPDPNSWAVVEHLLASDDEHARSAGKALRVWAEWGLGKLAFSRGGVATPKAGAPVTTFKAKALTLPPAGTQRENYDQAERISVATMKLITGRAMQILSDSRIHGFLGLDEIHAWTTTSDGLRFLERIIRMSRSMNITVALSTQLHGDLGNLEELIGVRFSFRQETEEQAAANLRAHGLDATDPDLIGKLLNFEEGRCLMRGLDKRVAAVRFDPGPEFLKAADTNPATIIRDLEQAVA